MDKEKDMLVSTLINDEESGQEELEECLSDIKKYDVKGLLDFWFERGRRLYVYMNVSKIPGLEMYPSVSMLSAGSYVNCLVDVYRKEVT